jgi:hypothetical protein
MGIVFFIDGFIWLAMPLLITWLIAVAYRFFNKDLNRIYFFIAFAVGLILLIFGPRCDCTEAVDILSGSLLYAFLFSVLSMSLIVLLTWFKNN